MTHENYLRYERAFNLMQAALFGGCGLEDDEELFLNGVLSALGIPEAFKADDVDKLGALCAEFVLNFEHRKIVKSWKKLEQKLFDLFDAYGFDPDDRWDSLLKWTCEVIRKNGQLFQCSSGWGVSTGVLWKFGGYSFVVVESLPSYEVVSNDITIESIKARFESGLFWYYDKSLNR